MEKQTIMQVVKFTLFSFGAGIIQVVSDIILNELVGLDAHISYLIALVLSVLFNFTVNRRFTFKSANNIPIAMLLVALFYVVFTPLSTWWTDVFVNDMKINEYIILALTMIINFVGEFLYCKFVVYRNSENTNDLAQKEEQQKNEQQTPEE